MFKEENRIWLYMIGAIILMVVLLLFARDYVYPFLNGKRKFLFGEPYIYSQAPAFNIDTKRDYFVRLVTNKGVITFDLFEKSAPLNINNFAFLAGEGYYDQTRFHRLIPNLLVQGGDRNTLDDDPQNDGRGGPGYFVADEVNWDSLDYPEAKRLDLTAKGYGPTPGVISHPLEHYSLAMANSLPNTNGSQFFVVLAEDKDPRLAQMEGQYTVIGKVYSGADVLNQIAVTPVDDINAANPRPISEIILYDVEVFAR